jgi:D-amino-acid dehydrogenase
MKIAVIGAGIIGMTTAYELSVLGHDVTVFDKSGTVAEYASFAPNGLIAPSLLHPMALSACAVGSFQRFARNLRKFSNLRRARPHDLQWLWQWSQHGNPDTIHQTMQQLHTLYRYSMERMQTLSTHAHLDYEHNAGQLAMIRDDTEERAVRPHLNLLKSCGVAFRELSRNDCLKIEPALALSTEFQTAIYFPDDISANCRQFAMLVKNELQHKRVRFQFNTTVVEIQISPTLSLRVKGTSENQSFDHIVLCCGSQNQSLLPSTNTGMRNAVVSSYTLTLPVREPTLAPTASIADLHNHTIIHRLGQRIRVCAGAELGAPTTHKRAKTVHRMYQMLEQLFPGAAQHNTGEQIFKGSQSISSTGLPVIGASAVAGVWLNTDHGYHGWGTACGAAKIIADLIGKNEPEIAVAAFHPL